MRVELSTSDDVRVELSTMSGCTVCYLVMMFVVVWCLALWLVCLCLVLCDPTC